MCSAHVAVHLVLIILMRLGRSGSGAGVSLASITVEESDTLWHIVKYLTDWKRDVSLYQPSSVFWDILQGLLLLKTQEWINNHLNMKTDLFLKIDLCCMEEPQGFHVTPEHCPWTRINSDPVWTGIKHDLVWKAASSHTAAEQVGVTFDPSVLILEFCQIPIFSGTPSVCMPVLYVGECVSLCMWVRVRGSLGICFRALRWSLWKSVCFYVGVNFETKFDIW